jgi:hypothetical protein
VQYKAGAVRTGGIPPPPDVFAAAGARIDNKTKEELDDAWFELEGAARDAKRHSQYLISQMEALRNKAGPANPESAAAWGELSGAISDAQAHSDYVEESIERYKKLTQSRLAGGVGGSGSNAGFSGGSGGQMR